MAHPITLAAALRETDEHRWRGMRSRPRNYSQATIAIKTLDAILRPRPAARAKPVQSSLILDGWTFQLWQNAAVPERLRPSPRPGESITLEEVTTAHLKLAVRQWLAGGMKPASIVGRLNCLSAMGISVRGARPRVSKQRKWWLTPQGQEMVLAALAAEPTAVNVTLADLILWTVSTGLRIEESLRLDFSHISERSGPVMVAGRRVQRTRTILCVPGSKTEGSQSTVPLCSEAAAILARRREAATGTSVFDTSYDAMRFAWNAVRPILNLPDPKVATLKALRRTAARHLHVVKGMPLDLVRQYLRHENIQTTMGYLRLTGGYAEEELAAFLD